jgi:hypothetical protein
MSGQVAGSAEGEQRGSGSHGRLIAWCSFVAALAALGYLARLAGDGEPAADVLYEWSTAIGGGIQYLFMAAIAVAIGRPPWRSTGGCAATS